MLHYRTLKVPSILVAIAVLFSYLAGLLSPAARVTQRDTAKNVIFMIGDGMGENHLAWAKQAANLSSLTMETFPLRGESETRSLSSTVTDSAAGGTALACGVRTINGTVGVYSYDVNAAFVYPMSLTELAHSMGKKAGVITTDLTNGATPADFTVHTASRSNSDAISKQQLSSPFDLIWGKTAGNVSKEQAEANGFAYITTYTELKALTPNQRSFAQFDGDLWAKSVCVGDLPTLSEMTVKAIDQLKGSENGFFLMVEGAHIDKNSHDNNAEGMQQAVLEFDNAVSAALSFAKEDGSTMIVITADHETGGITEENGVFRFTKTSHSNANVPLFVYGCANFITNGDAVKNKDIAIYTASAMGAENGTFPKVVNRYAA